MGWKGRRVFITGASGFLGRHLTRYLESLAADVWVTTGKHVYDLTDHAQTEACIHELGRIESVFHLAGFNGGIAWNMAFPAQIFAQNTAMALNVLDACKNNGVRKVVSVVASCAYPAVTFSPECSEYSFLGEEPHETVACHGYAKRNLQLASSFYHQEYGLNAVCACPTTLYGPGDSYDPKRTKVMGAMVKRFVDAVDENKSEVTCWGSGRPKREFLYVEDAAKMLVQVMDRYNDSFLPLNLGTGQEVSIRELAEMVAGIVGYKGTIRWDTDVLDGQTRKRLDLTRMQQYVDVPLTPLEEGISKTIEDYRQCKNSA